MDKRRVLINQQRFKDCAKHRGLTQKEVFERAGLNPVYGSNTINKDGLTPLFVDAVSRVLNVFPDLLIGGKISDEQFKELESYCQDKNIYDVYTYDFGEFAKLDRNKVFRQWIIANGYTQAEYDRLEEWDKLTLMFRLVDYTDIYMKEAIRGVPLEERTRYRLYDPNGNALTDI